MATQIFTVDCANSSEKHDRYLYGYWPVSMVHDKNDYQFLFGMVSYSILPGRRGAGTTEYGDDVVYICLYRNDHTDYSFPGQRMDGEEIVGAGD